MDDIACSKVTKEKQTLSSRSSKVIQALEERELSFGTMGLWMNANIDPLLEDIHLLMKVQDLRPNIPTLTSRWGFDL